MTTQPEQAPSSQPPDSGWERLSLVIQLALSLAVVGGVFLFLLLGGGKADEDEEKRPAPPEEVVKIVGPRTLAIKAGTPLDDKLDKNAKVRLDTLTSPILPVTGAVLASLRRDQIADALHAIDALLAPAMLGSGGMLANLRPGPSQSKDAWQFASADLLQVFADWQKSLTDVQFQKNQLTLITELNDKRIERQKLVVKRKRELLTIGTETIENLALEETNLIAFEIQRRKEIHEQATAVNLAERTAATLARQLQQNGLEPTMLRSAASEGEIVVAEVPETMIRHVKVGMHCKVEFFALPDHKPAFSGKVSSISPAISKEKRVANVQFIVKDPDKAIRPGMFARIGLGDERKALVMPADGVLHVGDHDYALVADDKGKSPSWQIFQVETGELVKTEIDALPGQLVKSDIEVLSGYALENPARRLQKDDRVIGKGAILLKPVVIRALQAPMAK